ncbi:MAG: hypothetical protein RMK29_19470 [Myxococcales bacterium]|nr:hypothetical protein [Myxococcota bacterium]MDW8283887.1 hypothetical protein [Myxococcales bacterium]
MNRTLRNLVLGAGSLDSVLAAHEGPNHPLLSCVQLDPHKVADAAAELQRDTEALGVPEVDATQRQRAARVDGVQEAERAIVGAMALLCAPELEGALGMSADEIGELCNRRMAMEGVEEAAGVLLRCAADTQLLLSGLILFLDEEVQELAATELASDRLSEQDKQALVADLMPRLRLLFSEEERQARGRARQEQVLGRLQQEAEETEAEAQALRTIAAIREGQPVRPEELLAALRWKRQQEVPPPAPRRRRRR